MLTTAGHEGQAYELTGPEALSNAEQVAKISAAVGRPLRFVDVPELTAREGMQKAGMPEPFIAAMLEIGAQVKAGGGSKVTGHGGAAARSQGADVRSVAGGPREALRVRARKKLPCRSPARGRPVSGRESGV